MNLRFVDWIWRIRGSLALTPGYSSDETFHKLAALFGQDGTSYERSGNALVFQKKDQAAQDKMSVFDGGVLRIEQNRTGHVLRYELTSRILLFCFLAPLLFLGISQLTKTVIRLEEPAAKAAAEVEKASAAKKKSTTDDVSPPMNPIDKALGAPAPETPKEKKAKKAEGRGRKPSPTSAYVFAGIFATLYVVGRVLEAKLVRSLFRKKLAS